MAVTVSARVQEVVVINTHLLYPHNACSTIIRLREVHKILEYLQARSTFETSPELYPNQKLDPNQHRCAVSCVATPVCSEGSNLTGTLIIMGLPEGALLLRWWCTMRAGAIR